MQLPMTFDTIQIHLGEGTYNGGYSVEIQLPAIYTGGQAPTYYDGFAFIGSTVSQNEEIYSHLHGPRIVPIDPNNPRRALFQMQFEESRVVYEEDFYAFRFAVLHNACLPANMHSYIVAGPP